MSDITLTVLGCGSSSGAPVIGCTCAVCTGGHPKNRRSRCSAWLHTDDAHIVIDTGTDFRAQALREQIPRVDAVLYTHPHADHLNGIDDLRAFCFRQKSAIDIYGSAFTIENICRRFDYAFLPPSRHWNRPVLSAHTLSGSPENICGLEVQHFELPHGHWRSTVYRIGNIAWLTDINHIDAGCLNALQGLDYLFLDCLMETAYPSHLGMAEAFAFAQNINARQTYLIHMTHQLDYDELARRCPPRIAPAYDGLRVSISL
ncbi:MAG: MBL fold metallo-hydrolase [Neisseria sp.]|nr:MBL fold metallo-hydrolase [Neisseria sp.]